MYIRRLNTGILILFYQKVCIKIYFITNISNVHTCAYVRFKQKPNMYYWCLMVYILFLHFYLKHIIYKYFIRYGLRQLALTWYADAREKQKFFELFLLEINEELQFKWLTISQEDGDSVPNGLLCQADGRILSKKDLLQLHSQQRIIH